MSIAYCFIVLLFDIVYNILVTWYITAPACALHTFVQTFNGQPEAWQDGQSSNMSLVENIFLKKMEILKNIPLKVVQKVHILICSWMFHKFTELYLVSGSWIFCQNKRRTTNCQLGGFVGTCYNQDKLQTIMNISMAFVDLDLDPLVDLT